MFADGRILVEGVDLRYESSLISARISERIGNTQRRISFADGASCELSDNDAIDQWLAKLNAHSHEHQVSRLERKWSVALAAFVLVGFVAFAFVRWGIPAISTYVAYALPTDVDRAIGAGGLETLDELFFGSSKLPQATREQYRQHFEQITRGLSDRQDYRLEFRHGGEIGANAFALPSGIVVITDELIEIAKHEHEIVAVLAHEVGHVEHRHSLRMLLQTSGTAALMFGLLGDVGSISSLAASVPTVLVHMKHSRDFEREADAYSVAWLREHNIDTRHFGALLKRLNEKYGGEDPRVLSYFSSHPSADERAAAK